MSVPGWRRADLQIRGKSEPLGSFLIFDCGEFSAAASSLDPPPMLA
jgi:hypothetical protein